MIYNTSELCDNYADLVDVIDPIFCNYGGKSSFGGQVVTVKCFEHLGIIKKLSTINGAGKVLVIDGGGSTRRALLDIDIVQCAAENEWEGIICYGSVRDVDSIEMLTIGIQAIAAIPVLANADEIGETDVAINFAGVSIFPEDYIYADNTGIILSSEPLAAS